jgi:hypothetical protein
MNRKTRTLDEINHTAVMLLYRELGPVDAARFLNQFASGRGNYTEDRQALLGGLTLDEIMASIEERKRERSGGA